MRSGLANGGQSGVASPAFCARLRPGYPRNAGNLQGVAIACEESFCLGNFSASHSSCPCGDPPHGWPFSTIECGLTELCFKVFKATRMIAERGEADWQQLCRGMTRGGGACLVPYDGEHGTRSALCKRRLRSCLRRRTRRHRRSCLGRQSPMRYTGRIGRIRPARPKNW